MTTLAFSHVLSHSGHTIFDMSEKKIKEMEAEMRPGIYCTTGFLSKEDSLKEVVKKDLTTLSRLGISCEKIYHTLIGIIRQVGELGDRYKVDGLIIATNGTQKCPFGNCHEGRHDYVFTNLKTKESVAVSELAIDLIGTHAFFEGNVPYRVDPEKLCRVLEINPGDYEKVLEKTWKWAQGEFGYEKEAEEAAKKNAIEVVKVDEFTNAYLLPYQDYEDVQVGKKRKIEEKLFCHIFNHKERPDEKTIEIRGAKIKIPFTDEGVYTFEYQELTHAKI